MKKGEAPSCQRCGSQRLIRKGWRKKKLGSVQIFLCKSCGFKFNASGLKGRTYPPSVIIESISLYHLGHSLVKTGELIRRKRGIQVAPQTIHSWLSQFQEFCFYQNMRPRAVKLLGPEATIQTVPLQHQQVYRFRTHISKLQILLGDEACPPPLRGLRGFLMEAARNCPNEAFLNPVRPSQADAGLSLKGTYISRKENAAVKMARFALLASPSNKLRHETIQRFMLCNDAATVATEVPVWLTPQELECIRSIPGFRIPLTLRQTLAGHMDFVQARNGVIHILDYKPDAAKESHAHEQLLLYALALSCRAKLKLKDIRCAWFDDKDYFEFFPLSLVYNRRDGKVGPAPATRLSYYGTLPKRAASRNALRRA